MIGRSFLSVLLVPALLATKTIPVFAKLSLEEIAERYTVRTPGGVHLPIVRIENPGNVEKREEIGLGDRYDASYFVLVTVGNITTPLVLDTGSSDLWILDNNCTEQCSSTFQSSGIDIQLAYGDSNTGTSASGLIGYDTVSLAGITLSSQAFADINSTTTGVSGIVGINFPINSIVWSDLFSNSNGTSASQRGFLRSLAYDKRRRSLPSISDILGASSIHETRQLGPPPNNVTAVLDSWSTNISPFVPRLITNGALPQPLVAITLQRDTVDIGSGNQGLFSIGELPPGVNSSNLTWVGVRQYTTAEGGLPGPPDSPSETYPYTWEVNIDNVYLDGVQLPATNDTPASIGVSALIDTGTSLILGPADIITYINGQNGLMGNFNCSEPHILSFEIGGQMFPVDPRDFVQQATDPIELCAPNLAATDSPKVGGFLYSWVLGAPFLKSVLSAYYYGNITYPSQDPPKVGFLSTVPTNAGDLLQSVVASASPTGNFLSTTDPAPSASSTTIVSFVTTPTSA